MKNHALCTSIFALLLALASAMPAFCQKQKVRVAVLNGPSAIPCAYLIEHKEDFPLDLSFTNFTSAQTELPSLLKGEVDVGFLPPNAAAKVFNSAKGAVVCLGIAGNGNLFLISTDRAQTEDFSLKSLCGKTVYCAGQGATPEYMFRFLLESEGIKVNEKDGVTLDFSIPNANLAGALASGKIEYALVPEPFATVAETKNSRVVRALNLQSLYRKKTGTTYPMTLLVANARFVRNNPDAVKTFKELYAKSSRWTVNNAGEAGTLTEKNGLGLKAQVAEKAIKNAGFTWKDAKQAQPEVEQLLTIFMNAAPESTGGKLPAEDFYYER